MNDQDPLAIIDTPNTHGMFMLGTTTLYSSARGWR
jgi:hypothetical protein